MKKLKRIGMLLLVAMGTLTFASCKKEKEKPIDPLPVEPDKKVELNLSSISLNTDQVKKAYYIGDEFTAEGLKVTANFVKYVDGNPTSVTEECKEYYLNTENLNMNQVGEYPIEVIYRYGIKKVTSSYTVSVKSSFFDDSNVKYAAGLEITYKGTLDFLVDDPFTFRNNFDAKVHYFKNGVEEEVKRVANSTIEVDYTSVDTSKIGSYMIKYSYSEPVTINGKVYDNKITSFSVVSVSNPIQSIELASGSTTLPASVEGIDTSDWKIKVNKTKGEPEIVDYSDDLFEISGVVPFYTGPQTAVLKYKEDTDVRTLIPLNITESTKYDIVLGTEFSAFKVEGEKIQLDESGLFFVTNAKVDENRQNSNGTWKDTYNVGQITFHARTTIKGTAQPLEVVMKGAGTIVLYIASTGSTVRELVAYNPEGEELESFFTLASSTIIQVSITVDKAGTYKFACPTDQLYIHGCVTATQKAE